jgi:2-amino-4-hydroxy-6-hydroxymethyldihydropteridine diphosphokinase
LTTSGQKALIAVGSNKESRWGDPRATVLHAMRALQNACGGGTCSAVYVTPAYPAGSGPDFMNAAIVIEYGADARSLLDLLHQVEADAGRTRAKRWAQRTLDLDLIGFGEQVLPDDAVFAFWRDLPADAQVSDAPDQLILPHPRLQDRSFVLVPLAEVAPTWVHPVSGLTILQMRDARPAAERDAVRLAV